MNILKSILSELSGLLGGGMNGSFVLGICGK